MSTEESTSPISEKLLILLREGQDLVENPDLKGVQVELWVIRLRSLLIKLFGQNTPQLRQCPMLGQDDPKLPQQERIKKRLPILENVVHALRVTASGKKIFIGHGRSSEWLKLKSFLSDRLSVSCDEFNIEPTAGIHTTDRLETMLLEAGMAFLVMTAEDKHVDGTIHARENVIHEIGLFQGQLGSRRAIVMIEEGCAKFSNLAGLTVILFSQNDISARFEDIRRVLEREGFA